MIELSPELQKALDEARGNPPRLVDPRTQQTYLLVPARGLERPEPGAPATVPEPPPVEVPEGIRRSRAALRRDLSVLLSRPGNAGKLVCYRGDERIAIGTDYAAIMRECNRREFKDDEFVIDVIGPTAGSEEEEEIDRTYCDFNEEPA